MTELILVRHGATEWNMAEVFRGQVDVDLNETGIKQAEMLASYLSTSAIEAIYPGFPISNWELGGFLW